LFAKNRLISKPSRLTLGVGAATVAAVAGIAIGAATSSTSPASPTTAAGNAAALNRAGTSQATSHAAAGSATPAATGRRAAAPSSPARHASAHPAAAKPGTVTHHPAVHRAPAVHHRAAAAGPAGPYLVYDSVIPSALPANHVAAAYATGPFAASPAQLAGKGGPVVWIDTRGSDPAASALDVEPGDATPSVAASWAFHRLSQRPHAVARIYTMISEWAAVKAAVAGLPQKMQSRVRWWIADPTGVAHLVPGSDATQWYWGSSYDISTATPRF